MPTSAHPEELSQPGGAFVVIYEDDRPVAGGGLKRLDDDAAEIKRMFVVPEARSRGHARRLLFALEDAARDLGYRYARLDTGPRQPHARALYESAGYREVPNYNANEVADYWGEKVLCQGSGSDASDGADGSLEPDAADAADAGDDARTWHGLVTEPRAGVRTAAGAELNRYAASRSAAAAATAGRSGNRRETTFDTPLPAIETP